MSYSQFAFRNFWIFNSRLYFVLLAFFPLSLLNTVTSTVTCTASLFVNRHSVWGMGMEDFVVLWVLGFCGDSHRFSVGMGWIWGLKSDPHGSLANRGAGLVNPSAQNSQSVAGSWDNWVNKSSWVRMVIGQYWWHIQPFKLWPSDRWLCQSNFKNSFNNCWCYKTCDCFAVISSTCDAHRS